MLYVGPCFCCLPTPTLVADEKKPPGSQGTAGGRQGTPPTEQASSRCSHIWVLEFVVYRVSPALKYEANQYRWNKHQL